MTREELIECAKRGETLVWGGDEYLLLSCGERLYSLRRVTDGFTVATDFTDHEMWSRPVPLQFSPEFGHWTRPPQAERKCTPQECGFCGTRAQPYMGVCRMCGCAWQPLTTDAPDSAETRRASTTENAPVDPYVEHREKNRDIEAMTFKCAVADGITGVQHTCASCATPIPDEAFEPALGYVVRVMNCRVCGGAV